MAGVVEVEDRRGRAKPFVLAARPAFWQRGTIGSGQHLSGLADAESRRSYAAAVRRLSGVARIAAATPDSVARYLADYAATLSVNTLKSRLAGLWRSHPITVSRTRPKPHVAACSRAWGGPCDRRKAGAAVKLLLYKRFRLAGATDLQGRRRGPPATCCAISAIRPCCGLDSGVGSAGRTDALHVENIVEPGVGLTCFCRTPRAIAKRTGQRSLPGAVASLSGGGT